MMGPFVTDKLLEWLYKNLSLTQISGVLDQTPEIKIIITTFYLLFNPLPVYQCHPDTSKPGDRVRLSEHG